MKRNGANSVSWKAGLVGGLLLALSPALAVAQQSYATATLYEVREDVNCNPGDSTDPLCQPDAKGFGVRIADATLTGAFVGPGTFTGPGVVEASSILNQRDWTGPAHGKITLDSGVRATFSGQLNLAAAMATAFAPISGRWQGTKGTLHAGGDFAGKFFIPFQCAVVEITPVFCYVQLDDNGRIVSAVPLGAGEFSASGMPLVKLEVSFYNN